LGLESESQCADQKGGWEVLHGREYAAAASALRQRRISGV